MLQGITRKTITQICCNKPSHQISANSLKDHAITEVEEMKTMCWLHILFTNVQNTASSLLAVVESCLL